MSKPPMTGSWAMAMVEIAVVELNGHSVRFLVSHYAIFFLLPPSLCEPPLSRREHSPIRMLQFRRLVQSPTRRLAFHWSYFFVVGQLRVGSHVLLRNPIRWPAVCNHNSHT